MAPDLNEIIREAGRIKRFARDSHAPEKTAKSAMQAVSELAEVVENLATRLKELERTVDRPKRQV